MTTDRYIDVNGCSKDILVFEFDGFEAYLTDFTFNNESNIYHVKTRPKGFDGQWYRFEYNGNTYVTDNLWTCGGKLDLVSEIKEQDICELDIVLNNVELLPNKDKSIANLVSEYNKDMINRKNEEDRKNEYWKDRKIILEMGDNGEELMVYVLKYNDKYELYRSNEPMWVVGDFSGEDPYSTFESRGELIREVRETIKYMLSNMCNPVSVKSDDDKLLECVLSSYVHRRSKYNKSEYELYRNVKVMEEMD